MKILLTGANGQLGLACQKQFKDHELFLGDLGTLDITNFGQCQAVFADFKPEVVLHAAAFTDVKGAETNPLPCYKVNAEGTYNLARLAREHNARLVYISTDYVFDGHATQPYRETDPVNPLSVYGRSKLAGELIVQDLVPEHYILRPAWMYGDGKNFIRTILALADKQPELTIVGDQTGTPTFAADLAGFIAAVLDHEPGIYHATNDGHTTWAEFARFILEQTGKTNTVKAITTDEAKALFHDTTERPHYSVLDKTKLKKITTVRPWQEAVSDYVKSVVDLK